MPKTNTWKSRTCPECKKRFGTRDVMKKHFEKTHNPAPLNPPPQNQMATMQYSEQQHISDLENKNRRLKDFAIEMVASIAEIALRSIR
jgi:hypothetical protein